MARPEQTEKATPKRRSEARKRGQIAKSPDLAGAAVFLAAVFVLHFTLKPSITHLAGMMAGFLGQYSGHDDLTIRSVWLLFARGFGAIGALLGVLFAASVTIALLANIAQFGLIFTAKPIVPSFSKINPVAGFTRIFSKHVVVGLAKQLLKLGAVFLIIYTSITGNLAAFYQMAGMPAMDLVLFVEGIVFAIGWKFGFLLVIVGLLDYAYERWQLEESLKMSKQEVKDEYRQSEGNPEAKAALKRRQREFARRRMMAAVPKATVVVTNPTHFAVALEWDEAKMDAPVVTAKGADLVAKRIRDLAKENNVPIMENPPLARTLYAKVDIDQAVPPNMYAAVAQVIAFVYKLKRKTIA